MEVAPNQGGISWTLATADGDRFTLTLPAGELGAKLSLSGAQSAFKFYGKVKGREKRPPC